MSQLRLKKIIAPGIFNRIKYLLARLYFAAVRRMYLPTTLPFFVKIKCVYKQQYFDFYLKHQLDIDLLIDTFVKEEYLLSDISKVKTVLDLGSNIGATVIFFKLLWPEAKIYAFEPDPRNVISLKKNTEQFGDSVLIIEKAVVPKPASTVTFYQAKGNHWSSSMISREMETEALTVPAITLDEFMSEYGVTKIDVCKFDIEGAEYEVFKEFTTKDNISNLIGEIHESLMKHTKDDFINLFPNFYLKDERPGDVIYLKRK